MKVGLAGGRWLFDGRPTNPGSAAEGVLLNVRMVNATFEDAARPEIEPDAAWLRSLDAGNVLAEAAAFGKPVVCNEDAKVGNEGAAALAACVARGVSWGLMEVEVNQLHPFCFEGPADDPVVYAAFRAAATARP